MLPPMWDSDDQKKQSVQYANNFSTAIRATGVKNVVFLSSYGAHRRSSRERAGESRLCRWLQFGRSSLIVSHQRCCDLSNIDLDRSALSALVRC